MENLFDKTTNQMLVYFSISDIYVKKFDLTQDRSKL